MKDIMSALTVGAVCLASAPPAGAQGFGFATFSAVVNGNGSTASGSGVHSSQRTETGRYIVRFTRNMKNCAFVASPRGAAGGQASVQPVEGQPARVEVSTFNKSGVQANRGFTLLVSCI